jgi:hypothetical protein
VADAATLAGRGAKVALLLIQNGVAGAVAGVGMGLEEFLSDGGELWVDRFSVRPRALAEADLMAGARLADMDEVAEKLLTPGVRAVWH